MRLSHESSPISPVFDDPNLVASTEAGSGDLGAEKHPSAGHHGLFDVRWFHAFFTTTGTDDLDTVIAFDLTCAASPAP